MNAQERIDLIRKSVTHVKKYPICIEKFRITLRVREENRNDPVIVQRGKILKACASEMPIVINPAELIVGNAASKHMGMEIDPDYGIWTKDELDSLVEEGTFEIDPADVEELLELNEKHAPVTLIGKEGEIYYESERMINALKAGIALPPWKDKKAGKGVGGGYAQSGFGLGPSLYLMTPDFETGLSMGTNAIIERARELRDEVRFFDEGAPERFYYYTSVIDAFESINILAMRYSKLAAEMAASESDPERKAELEQISEICSSVPMNPPQNFREAMQAFWFYFLMMNPDTTIGGGRFDQFMWPYCKKDLESGAITRDEVVELLALLRLKDMELNRISGSQLRKKNSGMAKWHNFIIGGVDAEGNDATNELSYMMLDAALLANVPHHTITIRVHENTPEELLVKGIDCLKAGLGLPAFIGDKSYIQTLVDLGLEVEDARNYFLAGCLDVAHTKARGGACPMVTIPLLFDIFRHNGIDVKTGGMAGIETGDFRGFKTYDELFAAMRKQFEYLLGIIAEKNNVTLCITKKYLPDPIRSVLTWNGLEAGAEMFSRTMPAENGSLICPIGTVNVGDSLTAIKKLVFEEGRYTLSELYDALEADWVGYEDMRKDFLAAPKYGNNDPYADEVTASVYHLLYEIGQSLPTPLGDATLLTGVSITSHEPGGALVGATPDGRKAGTLLSNGSTSPMQGADTSGPLAVFNSALRINQDEITATLVNMKFHTSALKSLEDEKKLASMIKTYLTNGGKHVQFNVVDQETLVEAQQKPEEYEDLIVRVAGYSTYFTTLSEGIQNDIIERTSQSL